MSLSGNYRDDGRSEDPNTDGPLSTPWYVWLALAGVTLFGLYLAFGTGDRPAPSEPTPPRPSVIMPVNSWSS